MNEVETIKVETIKKAKAASIFIFGIGAGSNEQNILKFENVTIIDQPRVMIIDDSQRHEVGIDIGNLRLVGVLKFTYESVSEKGATRTAVFNTEKISGWAIAD